MFSRAPSGISIRNTLCPLLNIDKALFDQAAVIGDFRIWKRMSI